MYMSFIPSSLAFIIPLLILFISSLLMTRQSLDREKASPFECGFDPVSSARLPFSLRFFLLAVLFLVFDIEIIILLPLPFLLHSFLPSSFYFPMILFLLILIIGLIHEWNEGSLDWAS
uniref:NADH dehydrogenase subunit 3 n=1 Tax=Clavisyllis tenjini TaxID=3041283 RepID=UPI002551D677|nr:NADH dehydrogenase subunit 3 [Clavisyllis tenjini]WGF21038.1 NADH dehydrogenase subunit 3 [Clavisyllis tenjini]